MVAQHLRAGAGTLAHAATLTGEAHDDVNAMTAQLSARIEGNIAGWQGAGSRAFQQLHQAWQEHHLRISHLLLELQTVFTQTGASFDHTDAAAGGSIGNVASNLHTRLG